MKRSVSLLLCAVLIFSCAAPVFGEDAAVVSAVPAMEQIVFTGEPIAMGLSDVVSRLTTTGSAFQIVLLNKDSDEAIARGYSEAYNSVQSTLDYLDTISFGDPLPPGFTATVSELDADLAKLTRNFAKSNLESNYQADLNSLKRTAVQLYYQTLQAQEYYSVAGEDLAAKQATVTNVQKRYNLGSASKMDLFTAQNALAAAENSLAEATVAYYAARMNFNFRLGYPLQQNVVLTHEAQPDLAAVIDLNAAVASAKETRNEVKVVQFAFELQEMLFNNMKVRYSQGASVYKKQEIAYLHAKQNAMQIADQMEMDVKIKFMGIVQKRYALVSAENTVALAKEAFRISQLTYNAGMSTLADLQSAEVRYNQAKLGRIAADTDYALALYDFEYAKGVGTFRLTL